MAIMVTKKRTKRSDATPTLFNVWETGMNPEQLAAINHGEGPARLLAAAGSGKTRVLVHRVARLVQQKITRPARILVLTFSKKAADEMGTRIDKLGISGVRAGTWHSLALQILKQDRTRWADWEIRESTKMELKETVGWKGMDWKGCDVGVLQSFISRCKANLFAPDSPEAEALAKDVFGWEANKAQRAFHLYNEKLEEKQILSYDDFLVFAAEHLADETNRAQWAAKFDYIIQDEAQDENQAQRHLAELLARDHRNYMVVGDCFQAIYGFRGSTPRYLAEFDHEWSGAVTFWLPRNYRSGVNIVSAANGIVEKATITGIESKAMVAERKELGTVRALVSETLDDEGSNFVGWIQGMVKNGEAKLGDFTALFRTNAQSRALEEALLGSRIPYVVVGGVSFYERKEVRDVLGYLRIACGRGQMDDVKRCINAPFRYLGLKFVERIGVQVDRLIEDGANPRALAWAEIVNSAAEGERIQGRQVQSANEWSDMILEIGQRIAAGAAAKNTERDDEDGTPLVSRSNAKLEARPETILNDIVKRTKYLEWITKEEGEENIESSGVANVRELIRVSSRFATCDELLDYIDETIRASRRQRDDKQAGGERVLLMSVHRSKGLEWPHVWVAGCNEMILPHPKGDPEEERRLAYVAVTRARDSLVMSYVRSIVTRTGIKDAAPSRFIADSGVRLDAPGDMSHEEKRSFAPVVDSALT
jgi:DNA helicase-2/ATP-dependent DNA helicase PcrA